MYALTAKNVPVLRRKKTKELAPGLLVLTFLFFSSRRVLWDRVRGVRSILEVLSLVMVQSYFNLPERQNAHFGDISLAMFEGGHVNRHDM